MTSTFWLLLGRAIYVLIMTPEGAIIIIYIMICRCGHNMTCSVTHISQLNTEKFDYYITG